MKCLLHATKLISEMERLHQQYKRINKIFKQLRACSFKHLANCNCFQLFSTAFNCFQLLNAKYNHFSLLTTAHNYLQLLTTALNLSLRKPKAQKSAKGLGAWGGGLEAKVQAFRTRGALLLKNAQRHFQTIFVENKLDNSIK